ncbi:hypothetical protein QOU27_26530, partial [Pseudomonas aeruginosa]
MLALRACKLGMLSLRRTPSNASDSSSAFDFDGHTEHLHYRLDRLCSGQPIPDSGLSFSSATAGGSPSLN